MRRLAGTLLIMTAIMTGLAVGLAEAQPLPPPVVSDIRFGAGAEGTRVVVDSDRPLDYFVFTLAEQRARVVIDTEHVDFKIAGAEEGTRGGAGRGLVAGYRLGDFSPERSRIVLDLAEPAAVARQLQLPPAEGSPHHRLVLDLAPTSAERFAASAGYPEDRVAAAPTAAAAERAAGGIVVVLDPGHGGDQPGAIGVRGAREKDVNLAIALAVRERLEADGRYRVVMTRADDRRVELHERVRIAREAGADLFLSIHADAAAGADASLRGASVYTLADYAESRTRTEILSEDPWILDVDLERRRDEVGDILIDLVHRDTKNQSTVFAETLIPPLRGAGPLLRNTHRSGGYYVLLAPDVPAVLLEAGFLTNAEDEARLSSPAHRGAIADAVVEGINTYFDHRERLYVSN